MGPRGLIHGDTRAVFNIESVPQGQAAQGVNRERWVYYNTKWLGISRCILQEFFNLCLPFSQLISLET